VYFIRETCGVSFWEVARWRNLAFSKHVTTSGGRLDDTTAPLERVDTLFEAIVGILVCFQVGLM